MAEEKITNTDEILSEEQLADVAGGSQEQIEHDLDAFIKMGVVPASSNNHDTGLLERAFKLYGITVTTHGGTSKWAKGNRYVVDAGKFAGKDVGQEGAWKIVNELYYNRGQHKFTP